MVDLKKTLSQFEEKDFGSAPRDASPMVKALYKLRHKSLCTLDVEDLRLAIGQDMGLPYLLPLALDHLEKDPFSKGMHYKGDLLCNVLRASSSFYRENEGLQKRVSQVTLQAQASMPTLDADDRNCLQEVFNEALAEFERS